MLSTGVSMPHPKTGGNFGTMAAGTAFFAGVAGAFYYSRSWAHSKDDQTWIVRHGQQPNNRAVQAGTTSKAAEPVDLSQSRVPLPGNAENRRTDTFVDRVKSTIVGRNGNAPPEPNNNPVPSQQRMNEAGTHFYTKNLPFDVKAYNIAHRANGSEDV